MYLRSYEVISSYIYRRRDPSLCGQGFYLKGKTATAGVMVGVSLRKMMLTGHFLKLQLKNKRTECSTCELGLSFSNFCIFVYNSREGEVKRFKLEYHEVFNL